MIIGKFYEVPAVYARDWWGFDGWIPVLGPMHEDAEIVGFPWQHFHIDWRFARRNLFDFVANIKGPQLVYASPIQCPDRSGKRVIAEGPILKRMTYKRELLPFPRMPNTWVPVLAKKYACTKLVNGLCPHRGIPVSAMHREGDILTCPGHGLQWNAITGLPHTSNSEPTK
ncbi:MAG: hypothetical protein JWO52_4120 [Gammaproteobacteria bacterium]|nr:hypothetical protein [Gammaproteobacteria bacterium]